MDESPWRALNQVAAIPTLFPDSLLPRLARRTRILELGCGQGAVCRFLAERGMIVVGVDINEAAIALARTAAGDLADTTFLTTDVLQHGLAAGGGAFDAVLMIRFLTCFPEERDRRALLALAKHALKSDGLLYVRDFLLSEAYQTRYENAVRTGMLFGNFPVLDADGSTRFVAHHHSEEEARAMLEGWECVSCRVEDSLSMNGNPCRMFEFVGRSSSPPSLRSLG